VSFPTRFSIPNELENSFYAKAAGAPSRFFYVRSGNQRLALKKVWNPVTCLRLLSEGTF
jgi:hypothetical protein